jgi:hypothetical protein
VVLNARAYDDAALVAAAFPPAPQLVAVVAAA